MNTSVVSRLTAALCVMLVVALPAAPAAALDNPLTVRVHGTASHLLDAVATIFGAGSGVLVDVTRYREMSDGTAVTLNAGMCGHPGSVVFVLSPFRKFGSVTQLGHSLATVAARARSMIIHQTSSSTSPALACGKVED